MSYVQEQPHTNRMGFARKAKKVAGKIALLFVNGRSGWFNKPRCVQYIFPMWQILLLLVSQPSDGLQQYFGWPQGVSYMRALDYTDRIGSVLVGKIDR